MTSARSRNDGSSEDWKTLYWRAGGRNSRASGVPTRKIDFFSFHFPNEAQRSVRCSGLNPELEDAHVYDRGSHKCQGTTENDHILSI